MPTDRKRTKKEAHTMVWCSKHGEFHKGRVRKYACECAKAYGTNGLDFVTWFNRNFVEIRDAFENEVKRSKNIKED